MRYQPPSQSFVDRIAQACMTYADKPCIQFKEETYTYADVDRISSYIAADLTSKGFKQGDHAAVYSINSARVLIVTLGILRAGGVWMPVNPRNSEIENVRALSAYACKAIFYQGAFSEAVTQVSQHSQSALMRFNIDDHDYANIEESDCNHPDLNITPDDLISLPMTGGTTGLPKCVMLSNANFNAIAYGLSSWYCDYKELPKILSAAPMTHVGGRIALSAMISGACMIVHEKFSPRDVLKAIETTKITDIFLPPTAIYSLLEEPNIDSVDFSSLRNFLYGSAPIALEKLKQCLRTFGPVMRGAYGQTETPLFVTGMAPEDHFVDGEIAPDDQLRSVGRSTILSELSIVDDNGAPVPQGQLGEVAVKGPMVCTGYYKNKTETDKIQKNGWHLTGDIAYQNADGFLYLMDRKKDMIITGGFNVYSAEVENVINQIPGVRSSQVIGVPSERWGEEVKALVQKEPGSDVNETQISDICREQLGSVKMPKSIEFRDAFPLTSLGKIDKKALRATFWPEN